MYGIKKALFLAGVLLAFAASPARAVMTLEVKISLQVVDFISAPAERTAVAVVYDKSLGNGSMEEAVGLLQALQDAAIQSHSKISPKLMEVHALPAAPGLKAIILPPGMESASLLDYGIANQTLILSMGVACVREHRCMVGVRAQPEIEIGLNSPALHDAHIRFADGFQLMVKEY